jgi:hypothetical protein
MDSPSYVRQLMALGPRRRKPMLVLFPAAHSELESLGENPTCIRSACLKIYVKQVIK